jgi:hypothetical protein
MKFSIVFLGTKNRYKIDCLINRKETLNESDLLFEPYKLSDILTRQLEDYIIQKLIIFDFKRKCKTKQKFCAKLS